MGGFNADESLIDRVKILKERVLHTESKGLLDEVVAVLEGRLMIDAKGMLHLPCDHHAHPCKPCKKCSRCGQTVPEHYLVGEEEAAKWAAKLIVEEIHWDLTLHGADYWGQVYKNLREMAGGAT